MNLAQEDKSEITEEKLLYRRLFWLRTVARAIVVGMQDDFSVWEDFKFSVFGLPSIFDKTKPNQAILTTVVRTVNWKRVIQK